MEMIEQIPCPVCGELLAVDSTTLMCPSCGTSLEVLADEDYWPSFAMFLLGVITGAGGLMGVAAFTGYKMYKH